MCYSLHPAALSAAFPVPSVLVDRYIRLAGENQLKVILYILRSVNNGISVPETAQALGLSESEVRDACLFWVQAGLLCDGKPVPSALDTPKSPAPKTERPSREDVSRRGLEDEQIRFLLAEAQMRLGRNLKTNEAASLVWLYDDQGMNVSVLLLLLQYAVSEKRTNLSFIEKTALQWIRDGVETVTQAEEKIAESVRCNAAWKIVSAVFGLERRQPSEKETRLADLWLNDWHLSQDLLKFAYDTCVDTKSSFSMPYTAKILERWHEKGFRTPQEAAAGQKSADSKSAANYSLDTFERLLNAED